MIAPLSLVLFILVSWQFSSTNLISLSSSSSTSTSASVSGRMWEEKKRVNGSRIAICLVGAARRFELTGPSILKNILLEYPNADLFLHSPLDKDAFKFSLLRKAPRIAGVRIFTPVNIAEDESQTRVLTSSNSPNGIQGLLQYFNLVEGCLTMIRAHEEHVINSTYEWIVRTRVDGYWSAPLESSNFVTNTYTIPTGSNYGGLNDRFGVGDRRTSTAALSRLSLIPQLESSGYQLLNSEAAFKAQLVTSNVTYRDSLLPFCILSDRMYNYPPTGFDVPVTSMGSTVPLSGAKCRPCRPACVERCVEDVLSGLNRWWSWTENEIMRKVDLCDASGVWEEGWDNIFDEVAGRRAARMRRKMKSLVFDKCVLNYQEMMEKTVSWWESPSPEEICKLGQKQQFINKKAE